MCIRDRIWNHGIRPGYSGTLVLTMREPLSHSLGFGIEKFDIEGRLITLEFEEYYVLNIYAPSIHENNGSDRPDYRREWDEALRNYVSTLLKPVILCGDFNATGADIDTYPKQGKIPDDLFFLPETRDGFLQLLEAGFVDVFRRPIRQKRAPIHGGGQSIKNGWKTAEHVWTIFWFPENFFSMYRTYSIMRTY